MEGYGENLLVNHDALEGIPVKQWQLKELSRLNHDTDVSTWREAFDAIAHARNCVWS